MSGNQSTSSPAAGNPHGNADPENVTLRIVILAHGNRREDDLYLVLGLDTTLDGLKSRIQESLPQRPPPNQQRIIYQGRGLENANETLRSILRQDSRVANSSYVLHLVIRQAPPGSQPSPPTGPAAVPGQMLNNPALQSLQPQDPRIQVPQISPHDAHMRIHNQIHQLQHSLQHQQAINRAQMAQALPHLPQASAIRADQARLLRPDQLAAGQVPPIDQAHALSGVPAVQIPPSGRASGRAPIPGQASQSANSASMTGSNSPESQIPHLDANQVNTMHLSPPASTTQIRTAINSDGQQTRTVINGGPGGTTTMTFRITGLNPPNPLDRPSSAPSASPPADASAGNNPVNSLPGNIQIHTQPPSIPMGFPLPPGLQLPFPMPNAAPLLHNPFQHLSASNSAAQPMAWLLSSPTGPQGIVFAPGHGFFNTAPVITTANAQVHPTPTQLQSLMPTATALPQQAQVIARPASGAGIPRATQPGAGPQPADVPAAAQPRARGRRGQVRPNMDQNEIVQFVLNRGWLFLRLYMFVFLFSESGTWRRILMIAAIIIYCALPQQNRLTEGLLVVRRHFDNLIGPPNIAQPAAQPTPRPAENANQQGAAQDADAQAGSSTSSRRRAAVVPTPEETARRLLEQQNRRNPNPIVDALYRIEQGVVLFLASLVPGVGERHVQARVEARRILQEEEQRRTADTQQPPPQAAIEGTSSRSAATSEGEAQRPDTEDGLLPDSWKTTTQVSGEGGSSQAASSGVDRNDGAENASVRARTTNTEQ